MGRDDETTARSKAESNYAKRDEPTAASDEKIVEAVGTVAVDRSVSQAQIALAWLRRNPVVAAPIVGALKTSHIDEAIAALSITLTDDEAARLEAPYTPHRDNQGISDPAVLARAVEAATGFKVDAAARHCKVSPGDTRIAALTTPRVRPNQLS